ncbi:MAG TPA: hypothetical protein VJ499_13200, partial [Flavisolibacter sp.]|nr:hypothetical protein [Flavisolibacter sp.]
MKRILTILLLFSFYASQAKTIIVGKNHIVTSLRKAVTMAANKDTILLEKGLYKEGNIVINKSIYLIGDGEPILDGDNRYEILTVSTNGAIIKGIRFQNAGYSSTLDYAAIGVIDSQNIIIENNTFANTFFAIHFANSSEALIAGNTIVGTFKS